jgi:multidrug resistance efflux pump
MVIEGDSVKKGQLLARIYADIYATQRDQAAASVNQQQAQVSNSQAQLEAQKSALDLATRTYERQKKLLADKVISPQNSSRRKILISLHRLIITLQCRALRVTRPQYKVPSQT